MGSSAELDSAKRILEDAYDQARAVGYQPGSAQMLRLAAAEHAYQQARRRDDPERAVQEPDLPEADLDLTATPGTPAGAADVEIDLRDTGGRRRHRETDEVASRPPDDPPPRPPGC